MLKTLPAFLLIVVMAFSLGTTAQAQVSSRAKTKRASNVKPVEEIQLRQVAENELAASAAQNSSAALPTPATVRSKVLPLQEPITYSAVQMGLSAQNFQVTGQGQVEGLEPYDLGALGTQPMFGLDVRWLPLALRDRSHILFGGFVSFGYAQRSLNLRTPTGSALENSKLTSIKSVIGATTEYHLPQSPQWSLAGNLGFGRLDVVQSSSSSFANQSRALNMGVAGVQLQNRIFQRFSVWAGYEYWRPVGATLELSVQQHQAMLGFLGSFR